MAHLAHVGTQAGHDFSVSFKAALQGQHSNRFTHSGRFYNV